MNKNTFSSDSKQRYDEMMARLAAKEIEIEKKHQDYLKVMRAFNEKAR